ncbi:MAG: type II toxin-antitoxin system VapC family toxin [Candidatus Thermoplasmatota archaeon]|nr:type II toxin-antitoxin system VapC family toxin [Candidatus Thermoplasmatota archaeon]
MSEYLDTSVIVKWFREQEPGHREAMILLGRIKDLETEFVMSEYGLLELVRALVKAGFPKEEIETAFQSIHDLYEIGALQRVPMEEALFLAKDIEMILNLYASDSLHLASAIQHGCKTFWTADKHHLKDKTQTFMQNYKIDMKSP